MAACSMAACSFYPELNSRYCSCGHCVTWRYVGQLICHLLMVFVLPSCLFGLFVLKCKITLNNAGEPLSGLVSGYHLSVEKRSFFCQ